VRIDPKTAPIAIKNILENANISVVAGADPTILAKACKNKTELDGCIKAHIRDGAAVVEFLSELKNLDTNLKISEIDLVKNLENKRIATGKLKNISFDTICGSGPNGAIVHYRVNTSTNRTISTGDVLLIDSGGQYLDGTTDITRTIAIGSVPIETVRLNTLVLKGMIAISCLRFPKGLAGRDIDAIARQALWSVGLDFDHGTGHGVGSFLSVHEGPHGISRHNQVPFEPGMIISNEPGYYEEGHFGIRIENLIYVKKATNSKDTNSREMLKFETLTLAPIDQTLIDISLLSHQERKWINDYHANVLEKLYDLVSGSAKKWLNLACAPL
jgi:Xaa-Pro aminopeptidase